MNDQGLEKLVNFPTLKENTLDLNFTLLPGQFQEVHSPVKQSEHDTVAGTLKVSNEETTAYGLFVSEG